MGWTQQTEAMMNAWQQMVRQSFAGWTGDEGIARQIAGQFVTGQAAMARFVELVQNAWANLLPQIESGEDWQGALQDYVTQMRDQFLASQTAITGDMGDLWALYIEEMGRLGAPWMTPFKQWMPGQLFTPGRGSDLIELTNLYWDAFERTFGSLLESPQMGYARELNEKIAKGFDSWLEFRRASVDYQATLADAWAKAFEQLIHEMADRAEQGEPIDSLRDLLLLWGQVADRVFVDTFRTDEYIRIQGQLLNAAMTYRLQQRSITEVYLKVYDLPTRCEVDEAHRNIYELRKEVKSLKKALAELQKPKPRRKSTRAKKAPAESSEEG